MIAIKPEFVIMTSKNLYFIAKCRWFNLLADDVNCWILDHVCIFLNKTCTFALKCEHVGFLQDFIVWPKCPQIVKSRTLKFTRLIATRCQRKQYRFKWTVSANDQVCTSRTRLWANLPGTISAATKVSGRCTAMLERKLGYFVNTLCVSAQSISFVCIFHRWTRSWL